MGSSQVVKIVKEIISLKRGYNIHSMLCVQGQATDIAIQAEEILKLKRQINNIYSKHTGQPLETIGRFSQLFIYNPLYVV